MAKELILWEELAYGSKNHDKVYQILDGVFAGRRVKYHSVHSYDGDIDAIVVTDIDADIELVIRNNCKLKKIKKKDLQDG